MLLPLLGRDGEPIGPPRLMPRGRELVEATAAPAAEPPPVEDPPPSSNGAGEAAAGIAAALAAGGVAAGPMIVAAAALKQGADTVAAGTKMVLVALAASAKTDDLAEVIAATVRDQYPEMDEGDVADAVVREQRFHDAFMTKMRARVARDLPKALRETDMEARREAVRKIIVREQRFIAMRREAVQQRLAADAEMKRLKVRSPEGALWLLSDSVKTHTPDCVAMANKVWPWAVLALYHPPLHFGCPCRLIGYTDAVMRGLIQPGHPIRGDAMATAREIMARYSHVQESVGPDVLAAHVAVVVDRARR